jgi:osmotically-inducible protein OsmY
MPSVRARGMRRIAVAMLLGSILSGCAVVGRVASSDARITDEVKAQFAKYPELQEPNDVDVQTVHGVVYLRGLMATPFEVALASSVAGEVSGVKRVENLIGLENAR